MSLARLVITAVVVEGRSHSSAARDYGLSRVWVQELVHRYQREGPAAFEPRSRRPHTNPRAVDLEVEDQIVRLGRTLTRTGVDAGAETIAPTCGPPASRRLASSTTSDSAPETPAPRVMLLAQPAHPCHPPPHRPADPLAHPEPEPGLPAPRTTTRTTQRNTTHTPGGIPITGQAAARSRSQGWPPGHPQGPGLDSGENGHTMISRDARTANGNNGSRHLLTVSRDITKVRREGIEPPTR